MSLKNHIQMVSRIHRGARGTLWWTAAGFLPLYALVCSLLLLGMGGIDLLNMGFTLPQHELIVGLNKKDVSIFRVLEQGSAAAFSSQDMETMHNQPGVTDVHAVSYGVQPSEAHVAFFGQEFETEMVLQSFDPGWLRDDLAAELEKWEPGQLVPMVVNSSVLAIYNHAYAKANGLPELSESALKTPIINLYYGAPGKRVMIKGRVIGLSPKVALGLAIPRKTLDHLHNQLGIEAPAITELVLHLKAGEDVRRARETVEKLGFVINEPGQMLQVIAKARTLAFGAFWPLFLLLCLLATFFLSQGFATVMLMSRSVYQERLDDGAARSRLGLAVLAEGAVIVLMHLVGGSILGWIVAGHVNDRYFSPFIKALLGNEMTVNLTVFPLLVLNAAMLMGCVLLLVPRVISATRPTPMNASLAA